MLGTVALSGCTFMAVGLGTGHMLCHSYITHSCPHMHIHTRATEKIDIVLWGGEPQSQNTNFLSLEEKILEWDLKIELFKKASEVEQPLPVLVLLPPRICQYFIQSYWRPPPQEDASLFERLHRYSISFSEEPPIAGRWLPTHFAGLLPS